jgi:hypothetical protein
VGSGVADEADAAGAVGGIVAVETCPELVEGSSVFRKRKTRPPAWLPMKAACSGVAARARRRVAALSPAPGGATSTQRLPCSG